MTMQLVWAKNDKNNSNMDIMSQLLLLVSFILPNSLINHPMAIHRVRITICITWETINEPSNTYEYLRDDWEQADFDGVPQAPPATLCHCSAVHYFDPYRQSRNVLMVQPLPSLMVKLMGLCRITYFFSTETELLVLVKQFQNIVDTSERFISWC